MLNETGINILLVDSQDELRRLIKILAVERAYPLADIEDIAIDSLDEVFYLVYPDPTRLRRMTQLLSIKRGIISIGGKREFIGFNVDWMRRILAENDLDKALEAVKPVPVIHPTPRGIVVDHEPDDPFLELGYSRR